MFCFLASFCPPTHPYPYQAGYYCCPYQFDCVGNPLTSASGCCQYQAYTGCPLPGGGCIKGKLTLYFFYTFARIHADFLINCFIPCSEKLQILNSSNKFIKYITIFSDRLNLQLYPSVFSSVTTSNVGPFITRALGGHNSVSNCLTECLFTSANDCHFAFNNGNTCHIGTFKLWPIDSPPTYSTSTAYIYNGNSLN